MDLYIENGEPTAEELAALVAVLHRLASSTSEPAGSTAVTASAWWRSGLPGIRPTWRESSLPKMSYP